MIRLTTNEILTHHPDKAMWEKLLTHFGKTKADNDPLPFSAISQSCGLRYTLWFLRVLPDAYHPAIVLLVCDFAEHALRFVQDGEDWPQLLIETTRKWVRGGATKEELEAVIPTLILADADTANTTSNAARYAAKAAFAAYVATRVSANTAAYVAAEASSFCAYAAYYDAGADDDAYAAEKAWQAQHVAAWADGLSP